MVVGNISGQQPVLPLFNLVLSQAKQIGTMKSVLGSLMHVWYAFWYHWPELTAPTRPLGEIYFPNGLVGSTSKLDISDVRSGWRSSECKPLVKLKRVMSTRN